MSATHRPPTIRLLALAALLLAAGVFALRATALLNAPVPAPAADRVEQELTYLLEPITGADKVRVSVTGRSERTILVMVDGDIASDLRGLRLQIETVLEGALGYTPETDTLTLTQFPFAPGVGSTLAPIDIAELTGLGLLCGLLLVSLVSRRSPRPVEADRPAPQQRQTYAEPMARAPAPQPTADPDLRAASTLAESKPNETAQLVRGWMSYAED